MRIRYRIFLLECLSQLALPLAIICTSTIYAEDELKSRIDPLVAPYLENDVLTGLTVGVLQKGTPTIIGYGKLSAENDQTSNGDTVYEIGSTSKVFTGMLLADAVVRGEVQLDQTIQELVDPPMTIPTLEDKPMRLVDLATHVSGLPRLPDNMKFSDPSDPYADYTVKDLIEFLGGYQLLRRPARRWNTRTWGWACSAIY